MADTDGLQRSSLGTLTKVPLVTGAAPEVIGMLAGGCGAACRGGEEVYVASDSERDIGVMGVVGAPASPLSPRPPSLADTGGDIPYAVPLPLSVPGPVSPPELLFSAHASAMICGNYGHGFADVLHLHLQRAVSSARATSSTLAHSAALSGAHAHQDAL